MDGGEGSQTTSAGYRLRDGSFTPEEISRVTDLTSFFETEDRSNKTEDHHRIRKRHQIHSPYSLRMSGQMTQSTGTKRSVHQMSTLSTGGSSRGSGAPEGGSGLILFATEDRAIGTFLLATQGFCQIPHRSRSVRDTHASLQGATVSPGSRHGNGGQPSPSILP